jgi:methylmalonyl-CoA epimerase
MAISPKKVDHIGIAVRSVDEACAFYRDTLGLRLIKKETVEEEKVRIAMFKVGETYVELLEPTSPESSVAKFIEKRGEGIHHLAFGYDDVKEAQEFCKMRGAVLVHPEPEDLKGDRVVNFIHPKSTHGVLLELVKRYGE